MDINLIHNKLKEINTDNLPNILFRENIWNEQIENFTNDFLGNLKFEMLSSPLVGINADVSTVVDKTKVKTIDSTTINVEDYQVEFSLKTKENALSYISKHTIIFSSIKFKILAKDGKVFLRKESEQYKSFPPSLNTEEERAKNFDTLITDYNYTQEQIDYFKSKQEPIAGLLVANALLERFNIDFGLIDFSMMFPKISLSGDFKIENLVINTEKFISFIPQTFERKEPSKCDEESIYNQTFGNGHYNNGQFKVGGGVFSTKISGNIPTPNTGKEGEIFLFLPNEATKKLVAIDNSKDTKVVLAKSEDDWEIPPYLVSHKVKLSADNDLTVSWDNLDPTLNVKLGIYLDFYINLWIKVFKIKTFIGSADTKSQYVLDYKGKLIELYSGDLGFVGELWDPTNFAIIDLEIDTGLPDSLDKIASKILKFVLEPIIRIFITKVMITVTWPLISKYIFYGLSGESTNMSSSGRQPNNMPVVEMTEFKSDNDSMTIGIKRNTNG